MGIKHVRAVALPLSPLAPLTPLTLAPPPPPAARQLYELLLYLAEHSNHNVVTSALDALCQLLRAPPAELLAALLTEGALERSRLRPDAAPTVSKANS